MEGFLFSLIIKQDIIDNKLGDILPKNIIRICCYLYIYL